MIAVVALAALALGFGKAGVAGTIGPFVTLLLVLVMPADEALGVLLPMLIVADVFSVAAHWRQWETSLLPPLVASATVGIVAGSLLLSVIDEQWLQRLIGIAFLVFAVVQAVARGVRIAPGRHRIWALAAGLVAGFISTIAHAGGLPIVVYLLGVGLEPRRFVGTSVAFFAIINLIKVPGYWFADVFDAQRIVSTMWSWILIPVGVALGRWVVIRMNRAMFERIMLIGLVAGSVVLLTT